MQWLAPESITASNLLVRGAFSLGNAICTFNLAVQAYPPKESGNTLYGMASGFNVI